MTYVKIFVQIFFAVCMLVCWVTTDWQQSGGLFAIALAILLKDAGGKDD